MRQFLRYQVSGTVFLLWLVVFYYGENNVELNDLISDFVNDVKSLKIIFGLVVVVMPIGVAIHQLSILVKNYVIGSAWRNFSDLPERRVIESLNDDKKNIDCNKYCLDRLSNLNTFYYVRVDNGLFSPLLAWVAVYFFMERDINCVWSSSAIVIGLLSISYVFRIHRESKIYHDILGSQKINSSENISVFSIKLMLLMISWTFFMYAVGCLLK